MKTNFFLLLFLGVSLLVGLNSCKKKGCTDPVASNYNASAEKDNGNCKYDTGATATVERINYGIDERQHYDLHLPAGHDGNTKVVVLVHGGAWVLGNPASGEATVWNGSLGWNLLDRLLENGYGAAVMKYRLACYTTNTSAFTEDPMFYMDQMLEDVDLALSQLQSDASEKGYSADEYALLGESAGAQISLRYALKADSDPKLKTVVSFFSPAEMDESEFKANTAAAPYNALPLNGQFGAPKYANSCNFTSSGTVNLFWAVKSLCGADLSLSTATPAFTDTLSPAYSPNIQRNLPTFILHGANDDLVPPSHADTLISRITTQFGTSAAAESDFSASHKMLQYSGCGHGWNGGGCDRDQMMDDVISWLEVHL